MSQQQGGGGGAAHTTQADETAIRRAAARRRAATTSAPRPAPAPPPRSPSAPSYGGGGGSYGGGGGGGVAYSGKSVGSNSSGRISPVAPPPPAPPPPPSINQWLAGDTAYKQQMDASSKAYKDYVAQMTGQQNNYNTEYERNLMNTHDAEKLAGTDMENDYAARGLTNSGLFLKAKTDLATDYDKRESSLADGRAEFLANLQAALGNFRSTSRINQTKYRNEAIARRAAQYS